MNSPYSTDRSLSKKRLLKFVEFRSHLQHLLSCKNNISQWSQDDLLSCIHTELIWFHNEHERYNKDDQYQFLESIISLIYGVFPYLSKENKSKLYDLHRHAFFYL